jgi:hypothetical protein
VPTGFSNALFYLAIFLTSEILFAADSCGNPKAYISFHFDERVPCLFKANMVPLSITTVAIPTDVTETMGISVVSISIVTMQIYFGYR